MEIVQSVIFLHIVIPSKYLQLNQLREDLYMIRPASQHTFLLTFWFRDKIIGIPHSLSTESEYVFNNYPRPRLETNYVFWYKGEAEFTSLSIHGREKTVPLQKLNLSSATDYFGDRRHL